MLLYYSFGPTMHGVYYNSILPNTGRCLPTLLCDHGATVKGDVLWRTYKGGALCALDTSHAKLSHLVGEAVHSYGSAAEISVLSWIRQLLRTTWRLSQLLYDEEASMYVTKNSGMKRIGRAAIMENLLGHWCKPERKKLPSRCQQSVATSSMLSVEEKPTKRYSSQGEMSY
jgi:hypothetical protein